MNILALNPGSSTLKFGLHRFSEDATAPVTGVFETNPASIREATEQVVRRIQSVMTGGQRIDAVGCRVVHGGSRFTSPTRVDSAVLDAIRELSVLAPLHNPLSVAVIEETTRSLPDVPVIAVFDTSFHQSMPPVASTYALPTSLSERLALRRYGFHGISHSYVSARLLRRLDRGITGTRVITCHLGHGASLCAVHDGRSIDTSMGMTPMEGLVMGTRSGDIDPGLVLFLMREGAMSAGDVDAILNHQSGLLGLSGSTSDVRDLEQAAAAGDLRAEFALELFAYRAAKYVGSFAVALEGLDALAFSGGIGEHSSSMRARICRRLAFLGVDLDEENNQTASGAEVQIGSTKGVVEVWVIPTNEELEIARATRDALNLPLSPWERGRA